MLKAHGDYILPDNVPANEFLNLEDDKRDVYKRQIMWFMHKWAEERWSATWLSP